MKKLLFLLPFLCLSISVNAQEFKVPENYSFKTADDYAPYEKDVIQCVDWLVETPMYQNPSKRKSANAFLLQWVSGSPDVHIVIDSEVASFASSSPELMMVFMGGWAKYSLETKKFDDKISGYLAGLESMIDFYDTNKGVLPKNKKVEKYIKMQKKGTLRAYVEKLLQ